MKPMFLAHKPEMLACCFTGPVVPDRDLLLL